MCQDRLTLTISQLTQFIMLLLADGSRDPLFCHDNTQLTNSWQFTKLGANGPWFFFIDFLFWFRFVVRKSKTTYCMLSGTPLTQSIMSRPACKWTRYGAQLPTKITPSSLTWCVVDCRNVHKYSRIHNLLSA